MLIIAAVIVAAILILVTAFQTTYPESQWVRSRPFKVAAIGIAVLSAILMIMGGIRDQRSKVAEEAAQDELRQATQGLSRTVFPQDMQFELRSVGQVVDSSGLFVNVFVVPDDSPYFCQWQVTHTPNLSGLGQIFRATALPKNEDLNRLMFAQGVQSILFQDVREAGIVEQAHQLVEPTIVGNNRRRTLEEYERSYFVVHITGAPLSDIRQAILVLKGWRVPFIPQRSGSGWIGITVFRPTWEQKCSSGSHR